MKHRPLLALAAITAATVVAPAQATQEDLSAKRDAKLAEAWIEQNGWITDYDEARAKAETNGKPIFAYFSRSYSP